MTRSPTSNPLRDDESPGEPPAEPGALGTPDAQPNPVPEASPGAAPLFPYRLLFERANDAVFISGLDDRILDANQAACELYGYSRDELLSMHVVDLQAPERRGTRGAVITQEIEHHGGRPFETVDIRKDGRRIDVEVTTSQIESEAGPLAMSIARDISDRKQIERALRDSERQLRQSQRIGRIGSWEYVTATGGVYWSEELYRQFERDPKRGHPALGTAFKAYGPSGAQAVNDAIQAAIDSKRRIELDLSFEMPSGRHGVHNLVLLPVEDHDGVVFKIIGTTQDITDRKQAEEAVRRLNAQLEARVQERTAQLEQARVRLESVLEASPAVTYTTSALGEKPTTYVSPNLLSLFGYPASRAITNPFLLRTRIHPDDRARIEKQTVRLLADGQVTLEYRFLDGAGNYRWVHDEQRLTRSPDGTPSEIAGTLTDISQRKQAEQRLELIQAAVERVADGVVITARDRDTGRQSIVYANPAFAQVSGYPMDDILGGEPRMMYGAETRREDIDALRRRIEQTQPFEIELRLHRADGQPFHAELTFTPLLDNAGRPINWVTVVRDITQRKRDTELAQLHQSELAHVTRLSTMGEMASGLAHELNQPLAAIANYGQGALRRIETGNAKAQAIEPAIRHIVTQANRAGEIIRRLRDFVTKRETHRSTASINQLVAGVINLAARDITEQGAAVETDYATDLPELLVDTIQIEQVVLNLIRNAAEAMSTTPIGQPRPIQINTRLQHPYVVVEVTDRGHGLTAKQLDHLFDPFFTTKDEGMGMGLTISQSIIESHGGRLRARNNPDGDGATLWITLPIHPSGTD